MKKTIAFLAFSMLSGAAFGQQKIVGTVTYEEGRRPHIRPDVGTTVCVLDSTTTHSSLGMASVIEVGKIAAAYSRWRDFKEAAAAHDRKVDKAFRSREDRQAHYRKAPPEIAALVERYHFTSGQDSLVKAYLDALAQLKQSPHSLKAKVDAIGNYSISLPQPGTYYVLIQSANHRLGKGINSAGRLYWETVTVTAGEEKNVSPAL